MHDPLPARDSLGISIGILCNFAHGAEPAAPKVLNVIVLVGGHGYEVKRLPALFDGYSDIRATILTLKDDSEIFEDISGFKYDVIVTYNMTQKISEKRQKNLLALLDRGVGVVALHHSLANFQDWPEYAKIIGARFFTKPGEIDGQQYKVSGWKEGVEIKVHVEDADHPITKGLKDFVVKDETYINQWHDPSAKLLLSTDEKTNDKPLAWAKTYGRTRTAAMQLGHGPEIYTDPSYRQFVAQAIRWVAGQ